MHDILVVRYVDTLKQKWEDLGSWKYEFKNQNP